MVAVAAVPDENVNAGAAAGAVGAAGATEEEKVKGVGVAAVVEAGCEAAEAGAPNTNGSEAPPEAPVAEGGGSVLVVAEAVD